MAKKQYFENLLGAMQESILKAHSMIENQHLNVMKRYFDESQKPLTFDIQYPRINPDHRRTGICTGAGAENCAGTDEFPEAEGDEAEV